jgi:polyisoprenoid-binding protein YceI
MKTTTIAAIAGFFCATAAARSATVEVDTSRSRIQVDAKATGHEFTGELKKFTLKAAGDAATGKPTDLDLAWDFNDLKTADEKRDVEMIKWLGGGKPKGSFAFVKSWNVKPEGGSAQGTLTVNGVSKSVSFPYTVKRDGEWVTLDGKVSMDYQNFKLPLIRAMVVMTVDPALVIRFHVVGKVK